MTLNRKKIVGLSVVLLMLMYTLYFVSRVPSQDGDWKEPYRVLPEVSVSGDILSVRHVRDFRYDAGGAVTERQYFDKEYLLSELKDVWFGISHFGDYGLAHAFASFEFSNGEFLVVSIEARMRRDQTDYRPVEGAFRRYTKFIVLATEQDVIGLRSHIRKERVYLYRLNGSMLQGRALLLNYMRHAETLTSHPEFYNTLSDNCLTGLLAESGRYGAMHDWLDYRILLPGYADELLLEKALIGEGVASRAANDVTQYMAQLRTQARIDPASTSLQDEAFSLKIRH